MAAQVYAVDLTVPAGTLPAGPVQATVPQPGGWVSRVTLAIPRGHNGLTGWALVESGTVIVPYGGVGWIIGNDHVYEWYINRYCNQGQLVVQGYNTGLFPHTFYFLADWDAREPSLPISASLAASTPVTDTTLADVASIAGAEPGPLEAALGGLQVA